LRDSGHDPIDHLNQSVWPRHLRTAWSKLSRGLQLFDRKIANIFLRGTDDVVITASQRSSSKASPDTCSLLSYNRRLTPRGGAATFATAPAIGIPAALAGGMPRFVPIRLQDSPIADGAEAWPPASSMISSK
jgi:hypothetical protein